MIDGRTCGCGQWLEGEVGRWSCLVKAREVMEATEAADKVSRPSCVNVVQIQAQPELGGNRNGGVGWGLQGARARLDRVRVQRERYWQL